MNTIERAGKHRLCDRSLRSRNSSKKLRRNITLSQDCSLELDITDTSIGFDLSDTCGLG